MTKSLQLAAPTVQAFVAEIFAAAGSSPREASLLASHLVEASLAGHDSHGIGMLPTYVDSAQNGELKLNQSLRTVSDLGAILMTDGQRGVGQVMAHDAMCLGIERARVAGLALVGLSDAFHIGRIGAYAEQAVAAGLVSLHFVNVLSEPQVAPFGGKVARLGTNPIAIGIPRAGAEPIIIDMATSRWAIGKVRVAHNKGEKLPPGILLDSQGETSLDPGDIFGVPKGALTTFGEHKGWCFALAAELLGAALVGGITQSRPKTRPELINSMLTILISPERLGTAEHFARETDALVAWVQSDENGQPSRVKLPGDPERKYREDRRVAGLPIDRVTWNQILAAARSVGLEHDPAR